MKSISVSKGERLQRSGQLNSKIYHVQRGLLRSYTIDDKGKEHTFMFGPEGWVVGDFVPPETPSLLFIEALEDSKVLVREKNLAHEQEVGKLLKRLAVLQQRVIRLMSSPALERYEHFLAEYHDVAQRIPQRMIASYLGITPEALSALKRDRKR